MRLKYVDTIGSVFKYYRKEVAKLTQEEFGKRLKLKKTAISYIETNVRKPTPETLELFYREFNVLKSDRKKIEEAEEFEKVQSESVKDYIIQANNYILELLEELASKENDEELKESIKKWAREELIKGKL